MKNDKVAFLVKGDADKEIIEPLVCRLLPANFKIRFVRMGGKVGLLSAYATVDRLLQKGYRNIFILFNSDSTDPINIKRRRTKIERMLEEHRVNQFVIVCPVVPGPEAWLLANSHDRPEELPDIKEACLELAKNRDPAGAARRIAARADLDLLKARSPSFAAFAKELSSIASANQLRSRDAPQLKE